MTGSLIGVDIGGTSTKLVWVQPDGAVSRRARIDSQREHAAELVDAVAATVRPWLEASAAEAPRGLGVAVPGLVDRRSGRVLRGANLPFLDDFGIVAALGQASGLHVEVDNDANAAGLAEARLGAARGCDSAVCLTVGFGIGAALIIGGRLWRGHSGMAGELGRLVLQEDAGASLEERVGAAAIVRTYRARGGAIDGDLDVAAVARRADDGDDAARAALEICGRRLGIGLAILINVINPQRIVVGGGIARADEWFLRPARDEARRRARVPAWEHCEVVTAQLGADAGAIGAALLCDEGNDG